MDTTRSHCSFTHENTVQNIVPLREIQTDVKASYKEQKPSKLLPRRLVELEKEIEEAKNEPLNVSFDIEDDFDSIDLLEDEQPKECFPIKKEGNLCSSVPKIYVSCPHHSFNKENTVQNFVTPRKVQTEIKVCHKEKILPGRLTECGKEIEYAKNEIFDNVVDSLDEQQKESLPTIEEETIYNATTAQVTSQKFALPITSTAYKPPVVLQKTSFKSKNKTQASVPVNLSNTDSLTVKGVTYVVLKELGKGGSSVVYDCFEPVSGISRAIKKVSIDNKFHADGFVNEVELLEKLQDCSNIIKMYDYEIVEAEKQLLVVLDKGNTDLAKIMKDTTHLPFHKIMYFWMEMLYAVKQIHHHGIVHCDLKPNNFVMDSNGSLKLIDFGISCSIDNDMTSAVKSVCEGSLEYMSPETLGSYKSVDPKSPSFANPQYKVNFKSDVWSLGCILYKMVYKKTPFHHIRHMHAKIAVICDPNHKIDYPVTSSVSPRVINTMKKCLLYNAKSRPSIDELIQEYENNY